MVKIDLNISIRKFKMFILKKYDSKAFLLEFNMDNGSKLSELVNKSETKSVLINYNIDVFDLKCTNFE